MEITLNRVKSIVHKVIVQPRNLIDEFNKTIQFIQHIFDTKPQLSQTLNRDSDLKELCDRLSQLTSNEYFHSVYAENLALKKFILDSVEILIRSEENEELVYRSYKIINSLLQSDIDLNSLTFRSATTKLLYQRFFTQLAPNLLKFIQDKQIKARTNNNIYSSSLLMVANSSQTTINGSNSHLTAFKLDPSSLESILNVICYFFVVMPFSYLMHIKFLPNGYDFLKDQLVAGHMKSQIMLAIAVNICDHLKNESTFNQVDPSLKIKNIDEEERIPLFENCVKDSAELLELNIRNTTNRPLLKKSLNIYCQYLDDHIKELKIKELGPESVLTKNIFIEEEEEIDDGLLYGKWQQVLYKTIIEIVRVLRLDFENENHKIDIELVIYFYELLDKNIENLCRKDASNIASKLISVIVRIEEWSSKAYSIGIIKKSQKKILEKLSFNLMIKFVEILRKDFCPELFLCFQPVWRSAIEEWNENGYKLISTFIKTNTGVKYYPYVKWCAEMVLLSWTRSKVSNENQCMYAINKREPELFFKPEILDAIVDLAHSYDLKMIAKEAVVGCFLDDIFPLIELVRNFFKKFKDEHKVYLFCKFYSKFFDFKSNHLKNSKFWTSHLNSILLTLNKICEDSFDFEIGSQTGEAILELIKALKSFFGDDELACYDYLIKEVTTFADAKKVERMIE